MDIKELIEKNFDEKLVPYDNTNKAYSWYNGLLIDIDHPTIADLVVKYKDILGYILIYHHDGEDDDILDDIYTFQENIYHGYKISADVSQKMVIQLNCDTEKATMRFHLFLEDWFTDYIIFHPYYYKNPYEYDIFERFSISTTCYIFPSNICRSDIIISQSNFPNLHCIRSMLKEALKNYDRDIEIEIPDDTYYFFANSDLSEKRFDFYPEHILYNYYSYINPSHKKKQEVLFELLNHSPHPTISVLKNGGILYQEIKKKIEEIPLLT